MPDNSISGQLAAINGVSNVVDWSIQRSRPLNSFKTSATGGGTRRSPGVGSWQGSWRAKGALPSAMPGAAITFTGYAGPSDGVSGNGFRYSGSAFVNQVVLNINFVTNEVVSHEVSFLGSLGLTVASGVAITDVTTPEEVAASQCGVTYNAGTALSDMTSVQLTITADVKQYVNSGTANETGRRGGKLIDWTCAIGVERTDRTLAEGLQLADLTIVVGPGVNDKYVLAFARVQEYSGFTANRETGDIIAQTLNLAMDSNKESDGTLGSIVIPGATTYWP
jgi:hypothetical protein